MSRTSLIVFIVLIAVIAATVVLYMIESQRRVVGPSTSPTSPGTLVGQTLFSDGEHGFSLRYPQADQTDYTFNTNQHLPANWRVGALPNATGTPILAVVSYRIENTNSYPRFFDAEVRIGASNDPKEVAACETAATAGGEEALPDVTLGSTTFKAFTFGNAAAMQYLKGVSYRTVHDGSCIAIEKFETGSSYRGDPPSKADIPQLKLDAAFTALDPIVASFSFARP